MAKKGRTTKYGEPIRRFKVKGEMKNFVGKTRYAYKNDAIKDKKKRKANGYLIHVTKVKDGYQLWSRNTPKSRRYEKGIFK